MDEKKLNQIKYSTVVGLIIISFTISYFSFLKAYDSNKTDDTTVAQQDKLSGEVYAVVYNEKNPFAPYFVGLDTITDLGVSSSARVYILDTLTNFAIYDKKIYKAKISFVEDSFESLGVSGTTISYSFKFGINDTDINKIKVESDIVKETIRIKIYNSQDEVEFTKDFKVYSS